MSIKTSVRFGLALRLLIYNTGTNRKKINTNKPRWNSPPGGDPYNDLYGEAPPE